MVKDTPLNQLRYFNPDRPQICITMCSALNLPFDEWTSVFGSERLTGALLDRLTHHVHILEMNGESYRLATSKKRTKKANAIAASDPSSHGHSKPEGGATDTD